MFLFSPFRVQLLGVTTGQTFSYVDKTGDLEYGVYEDKRQGRFTGVSWSKVGVHKQVSQNKEALEKFFERASVCYFPSSRKEYPHWLNLESVTDKSSFEVARKFTGELRKPIFVENSAVENQKWTLDVFLDSLADLIINKDGLIAVNAQEKLILKQTRTNLEKLLKAVLQDDSVEFKMGHRNSGFGRPSIMRQGNVTIPSLENLSSGQSILFNIFATIIRYADRHNVNMSIRLHEIEGIVLIDEVDAHLHSDLQYEVLPNLLALFPKVQFILTTHAPLFLLGMEKKFGETFKIIEMPKGEPITSERFSEFLQSFQYYQATKSYEEQIKKLITSKERPLVLTEGETDPIYILTALDLLNQNEIKSLVDIEWVGARRESGAINSGDTALNNIIKLHEAKPDFIHRKLLLLYDCDTEKPHEIKGLVYIRSIPRNADNKKIKKGIENLFEPAMFEERFYPKKTTLGDYGEEKIISEFDKMTFCRWVCEDRRNADDFTKFIVIIEFIKEFLGIPDNKIQLEPSQLESMPKLSPGSDAIEHNQPATP